MNIPRTSLSIWSNCQPSIQHRINALLNYQAEYFRLRVEFHRQLQQLQYTYNPQFEQTLEQRRQIIDGSHESVSTENTSNNLINRGIPNFWLTILKNLDSYEYSIRSRDEACLKYLTDIRCHLNPPTFQTTSFRLDFHFSPINPFFTETILTKSYSIRFQCDDSYPYRSYDGPEIDHCQGCTITWNPNHNLTLRKRNKRQQNKISGEIRLIQVEESIRSFFHFFSPPIIPENGIHEMNDEDQILLEADFEFGLLLKQQILPKAVLYYTGEALSAYDMEREDTSSHSSQ